MFHIAEIILQHEVKIYVWNANKLIGLDWIYLILRRLKNWGKKNNIFIWEKNIILIMELEVM